MVIHLLLFFALNIAPSDEQHLEDRPLLAVAGPHDGGPSFPGLCLNISPSMRQHLDNRLMPMAGSHHECCPSVVSLCLNASPQVEEHFNRSLIEFVLGVGVNAVLRKQ